MQLQLKFYNIALLVLSLRAELLTPMSNILFLTMQFETCNLKDFRLIILAVMVKQLRISYAYSSALPNRRGFFSLLFYKYYFIC